MAHRAILPTDSPCLPIIPMPWTSVRTSSRQVLESPRNWLRLMLTSAYRSGAGELEKQLDVSIIRRFDRFQIFHTCLTLFDQIGGTPSK